MPPFEALKLARGQGLDLVEVAPTANPPVCRIINYGKYLYQLSKRQHEARKHQRSVGLKEVKMRPRIGGHDYEVKRNRVLDFLRDGAKVKVTVMFRGREMAHKDLGEQVMARLIGELSEVGQVEVAPRMEGPNLTTILAPRKVTVKGLTTSGRPSPEAVPQQARPPSDQAATRAAAKPSGST